MLSLHMICWNKKDALGNHGTRYQPVNNVFVDKKTVGQYTGLEDKNGKKIFEGDIVELWTTDTDKKYKAAVAFGNPNGRYSWGWQLVTERGFPLNGEILLWVEMEDSGAFCEVIGNIHDNPELRRK